MVTTVTSRTNTRLFRAAWLIAPPILLYVLAFGLTLYGHFTAYRSADYADVNDISSSCARYMAFHPLAFAGAALLWMARCSAIIALLPEFPELLMMVALVIGHVGGTST